jgi:hypothetical protein
VSQFVPCEQSLIAEPRLLAGVSLKLVRKKTGREAPVGLGKGGIGEALGMRVVEVHNGRGIAGRATDHRSCRSGFRIGGYEEQRGHRVPVAIFPYPRVWRLHLA